MKPERGLVEDHRAIEGGTDLCDLCDRSHLGRQVGGELVDDRGEFAPCPLYVFYHGLPVGRVGSNRQPGKKAGRKAGRRRQGQLNSATSLDRLPGQGQGDQARMNSPSKFSERHKRGNKTCQGQLMGFCRTS